MKLPILFLFKVQLIRQYSINQYKYYNIPNSYSTEHDMKFGEAVEHKDPAVHQ